MINSYPLATGRKLNVRKTHNIRKSPGKYGSEKTRFILEFFTQCFWFVMLVEAK